jgi:hypothetical protein
MRSGNASERGQTYLLQSFIFDCTSAIGNIHVTGLLHHLLERDSVLDQQCNLLVQVANFFFELKVLFTCNGDGAFQLDEFLLTYSAVCK